MTVYKIWMNLNSNLNLLILTRKQKFMGTLLTGINTDSFRVSLFVFTNYELRCLFWGTIFVCGTRLWISLNKTIFYLHWLIINYVTTIDVNIYSTNCFDQYWFFSVGLLVTILLHALVYDKLNMYLGLRVK